MRQKSFVSSGVVGKGCNCDSILDSAPQPYAYLTRADVKTSPYVNFSLEMFCHNQSSSLWIRLSFGSPTLYPLSCRPCECRLKRPRILHGMGKEGGGPLYSAGCRTNAPQV